MIEKVDELKYPPIIGETYLVPCINRTPVINHPHSDCENGQSEIHYHVDVRFSLIDYPINYDHDWLKDKDNQIRIIKTDNQIVEYLLGKCTTIQQEYVTHHNFIQKSKLSNCIKNNKCPHRGYDLSQVEETSMKNMKRKNTY